jgi:chromate transporter
MMSGGREKGHPLHQSPPPFADFTRAFATIGLTSFGGPAGQIALMHRELVEERKWIDEERYLSALNFCHFLPGPEAQQLATYIGWKLHGVKGGLVAGLLFVFPGALVILGLSILYAYAAQLSWFAALFIGIKAAVLAIVAQALIRIAGRSLDTWFKRGLAVAAFAGLFAFNLPFPLIILGAGALGVAVASFRPDWLGLKAGPIAPSTIPAPALSQSLRTIAVWGLLWAIPMAIIFLALGPDHVLWKIGSFFSQLAVVTFGGAYAVLAYMAQEAVQGYGWLSAGEMADGLGLAETTPGPLIMVTQFVGFLAAFRAPEPFSPLMAGIIGAALTTWVTFTPCFLWIFTFAPWIERLQNAKRLKGGLAAITAAVVGVIANLTLWFALHVLFRQLDGLKPVWSSLNMGAFAIAGIAALMLFRFKQSVMRTLAVCAGAGLALPFLAP